MSLQELRKDLKKLADKKRANLLQGYFKTGKGEYAEGDVFIGLTVPLSRSIATKYKDLSLLEVNALLNSKIHEERLIALLILVHNFDKFPEKRNEIFNFYIKNTKNINNWDLVDLSAPNIFGRFIFNSGKANPLLGSMMFKFAHSKDLWEKRISIIGTFYFIKNNRFDESIEIANILLKDKHDLIHKAVGWMLREIGKKNLSVLENFIKQNYNQMPRTTLRYAIEKFPQNKRKAYLAGNFSFSN